jgi:hypothetical protein
LPVRFARYCAGQESSGSSPLRIAAAPAANCAYANGRAV